MPFISPNATLLFYPSTIKINIRELIVATCENIVTIDAEIEGDPTGHTYLWEQLPEEEGGGFPVVWLEPQNQLSVMYDNQGIRDDKLFKFTVDAGLAKESSYYLRCTAVPRDYLVTGQVFSDNNVGLPYSTAEVPAVSYIMPALQTAGIAYLNTPNRAIVFSSSTSDDSIGIELQQYNNGVWNTVDSLDVSGQVFNNISSNKIYRVISRLRSNGSISAISQPIAYAYPVTNGLNDYSMADKMMWSKGTSNAPGYIIEYKPVKLIGLTQADNAYFTRQVSTVTSTIQEIKFLVKVVQEISENAYMCRSVSSVTSTILEVKPLQLITVG